MARANLELKPTDKQRQFLKLFGIEETPSGITFKRPEYRYVLYGGAIRGGKTIALFMLFTLLTFRYPGSRWTIVRKDLETLKRNTIPSWEKYAKEIDPDGIMFTAVHRGDWYVENKITGSRILFFGENIDKDPDLERLNGHESNGYGLEEANELHKDTRDKCIVRAGSWVCDPMPPAIVPMTCNPAAGWVKSDYYDLSMSGDLKAPYAYIFANLFDNPYLPEEFIENVRESRENNPYFYDRYVNGNWEARDGDYFKADQFKVVKRHDMELFSLGAFADIAYTKKKNSDECAFGLAGINAVAEKHMFWSHGKSMDEAESIDFIIRKALEWKGNYGFWIPWHVEAHSSYLFALRQEMRVRNADFPLVELKTGGVSKWDRILNIRGSLYRWSWDTSCQKIVNQFLDAGPNTLDLMLVDMADMAAYADQKLTFDAGQLARWTGRPDPREDPVGADIWDKKHGRDNEYEVTSL